MEAIGIVINSCLKLVVAILAAIVAVLETIAAINGYIDNKFGLFFGFLSKLILWGSVAIIATPIALISVSEIFMAYQYLDGHGFHLFFVIMSLVAFTAIFIAVNVNSRDPPVG